MKKMMMQPFRWPPWLQPNGHMPIAVVGAPRKWSGRRVSRALLKTVQQEVNRGRRNVCAAP